MHGDEWLPLQGLGVDAPPCGQGYSLINRLTFPLERYAASFAMLLER